MQFHFTVGVRLWGEERRELGKFFWAVSLRHAELLCGNKEKRSREKEGLGGRGRLEKGKWQKFSSSCSMERGVGAAKRPLGAEGTSQWSTEGGRRGNIPGVWRQLEAVHADFLGSEV